MFGVVLWSDTQDRKAVIWCEDHGDLAYYRSPDNGTDVSLDAGDWVQFEMTVERHLRFAHNPKLLSEGVYSDLAGALNSATPPPAQDAPAPVAQTHRGSAEIIPFSALRPARNAVPCGAAAHRA